MHVPGIFWMSLITLAVSAGAWGGVLFKTSRSRRHLVWLLLPGLPLSALVNFAIKMPLARAAAQAMGVPMAVNTSSPWYWVAFVALLAPVTEELIKILPLAVPAVRKTVMQSGYTALWGGLALGMGFGLGEIVYLANGVARSPQYSGLPWYVFTGFFTERFIVVLLHGIMTALFASGLRHGSFRAAGGYFSAVTGHVLVNAGAIGLSLKMISAGVSQIALLVMTLILSVIFLRQSRKVSTATIRQLDEGEVILYRSTD